MLEGLHNLWELGIQQCNEFYLEEELISSTAHLTKLLLHD